MRQDATENDAGLVRAIASRAATPARPCRLGGRWLLLIPGCAPETAELIGTLADVEKVISDVAGAPLASRDLLDAATVVRVAGISIGAGEFTVMAGPCAVEEHDTLLKTAMTVRSAGAAVLRGGAYKPRTSPHSFQGLAGQGLRMLAEVSQETGLPVVTEVVDPETIGDAARAAHILQVGTRNAQNFPLLRAVGRAGLPVLLKRGFGCTVDEWLQAAEYILNEGNDQVILCERGIRTFERHTRFTLDLSAVPVVKRLSHLPIVVDPSHATGRDYLAAPLALGAAAVGADGLLVDVHTEPGQAKCDGDQALDGAGFEDLMSRLRGVLAGLQRPLTKPPARFDLDRTILATF